MDEDNLASNEHDSYACTKQEITSLKIGRMMLPPLSRVIILPNNLLNNLE